MTSLILGISNSSNPRNSSWIRPRHSGFGKPSFLFQTPVSSGNCVENLRRGMSTSPYEMPNWPASPEHLSAARNFLKSLSSKRDDRPVLIIPDRDVDGLTSGGIIHRVISRILVKGRNIDVPVRFVRKGAWIGDPSEKSEIEAVNPRYYRPRMKLIKVMLLY